MSAPEWTPGPWEWDRGDIPGGNINVQTSHHYADIFIDGGNTIIASFNDLIPAGIANANLITSAPDMFAALDNLLTALLGDSELSHTKQVQSGFAALAKARGEKVQP